MAFQLFTPAISETELRATVLGLKLSKILTRRFSEYEAARKTALVELERSGLFRILYIEIDLPGQSPFQASFGELSSEDARLIQAAYRNSAVMVCSMAEPSVDGDSGALELLLEYAAQQIGMSATREAIRCENQALDAELRVSQESLKLGKLMARATALIAARGLTTRQAQDLLVAASVRTGKPLVTVAEELLLAVSLPVATYHGSAENSARASERHTSSRPAWLRNGGLVRPGMQKRAGNYLPFAF